MVAENDTAVKMEERLAPEAAFALVGHETRFDILQALWDAGDERVTFSELRAAVGTPTRATSTTTSESSSARSSTNTRTGTHPRTNSPSPPGG